MCTFIEMWFFCLLQAVAVSALFGLVLWVGALDGAPFLCASSPRGIFRLLCLYSKPFVLAFCCTELLVCKNFSGFPIVENGGPPISKNKKKKYRSFAKTSVCMSGIPLTQHGSLTVIVNIWLMNKRSHFQLKGGTRMHKVWYSWISYRLLLLLIR